METELVVMAPEARLEYDVITWASGPKKKRDILKSESYLVEIVRKEKTLDG